MQFINTLTWWYYIFYSTSIPHSYIIWKSRLWHINLCCLYTFSGIINCLLIKFLSWIYLQGNSLNFAQYILLSMCTAHWQYVYVSNCCALFCWVTWFREIFSSIVHVTSIILINKREWLRYIHRLIDELCTIYYKLLRTLIIESVTFDLKIV